MPKGASIRSRNTLAMMEPLEALKEQFLSLEVVAASCTLAAAPSRVCSGMARRSDQSHETYISLKLLFNFKSLVIDPACEDLRAVTASRSQPGECGRRPRSHRMREPMQGLMDTARFKGLVCP